MRVGTIRLLLLAGLLTPGIAAAQGDGPPSGKPANLCRELVAFMRRPDDATKASETPARLATAVTAKASDGAAAQPSAPGTPQGTSGQSGPIAASGPGAAGPQGAAQNTAAPPGSTATASGSATDGPGSPRPSATDVERVAGAAAADDLPGCRAAAQTMRRAGIVMPGPLLALAAMAPKLLDAARH